MREWTEAINAEIARQVEERLRQHEAYYRGVEAENAELRLLAKGLRRWICGCPIITEQDDRDYAEDERRYCRLIHEKEVLRPTR